MKRYTRNRTNTRRKRRTEGSFARLHYYMDARRYRIVAKWLQAAGSEPRALELVEIGRPAVRLLITRDPYPAEVRQELGPWRVSRFDEWGASGHWNAPTPFAALYSLAGFTVPTIGPAHGSGGYRLTRAIA